MAKKKRGGSSYKAQYTAYKAENRAKRNKIKRLEKRVLNNENDIGAVEALKVVNQKVKFRQKPGQKGWFHPQEQALLNKLKDNDPKVVTEATAKLKELRYVYADKRASALRNQSSEYIPPTSILSELHSIGLINDKRYKSIESRLGSIRKRRAVSK